MHVPCNHPHVRHLYECVLMHSRHSTQSGGDRQKSFGKDAPRADVTGPQVPQRGSSSSKTKAMTPPLRYVAAGLQGEGKLCCAISCCAMHGHALLCPTMLCHARPRHAMPWMLCCALPCHAMLCYVMAAKQSYALIYHTTSCYAIRVLRCCKGVTRAL